MWDTAILTAPATLRHLITTTQRHLPECREGVCVSDVVVFILQCCCCCLNPTFAIECMIVYLHSSNIFLIFLSQVGKLSWISVKLASC